jgi:hypothetical protein
MDPDTAAAAKAMRSRMRRNRKLDWLLWVAIGATMIWLLSQFLC